MKRSCVEHFIPQRNVSSRKERRRVAVRIPKSGGRASAWCRASADEGFYGTKNGSIGMDV